MAIAKANHLPTLALYVIRPALVEAKLMTDKRARDAVYVVTLAEELRSIEEKIAVMEEALHIVARQENDPAQERACRPPQMLRMRIGFGRNPASWTNVSAELSNPPKVSQSPLTKRHPEKQLCGCCRKIAFTLTTPSFESMNAGRPTQRE